MKAYKLFRIRKDGSLGSLYINQKFKIPVREWLKAEEHKKRGFAFRPGWHATHSPEAPHIKTKGRQWWEVNI